MRVIWSRWGRIKQPRDECAGLPWRVAIQKPTDRENAVQAIVDINGHGISTSGSYRNYYELMASVSRTLSIRKRGAPLNTIWYRLRLSRQRRWKRTAGTPA